MSLVLGMTVALLGGGKGCQPVCCNMGMVYMAAPCAQAVFAQPVAMAGCTPIEVAAPVANKSTETESAAPVSQLKVEKDPALAAADRPETLSEELRTATATPVSSRAVDGPGGDWGGALGFLGNLGGTLGTNSGGFGFGNGQGAPGRGLGGGGGFGGGTGAGQGGSDVNVDSTTDPGNQGIVVNVTTTIANLNNNSQSQIQNQYQIQNQNQGQVQNNNNNNNGGHCCGGGGGEQVPLPATVWMGLVGAASAIFARRRGLVG